MAMIEEETSDVYEPEQTVYEVLFRDERDAGATVWNSDDLEHVHSKTFTEKRGAKGYIDYMVAKRALAIIEARGPDDDEFRDYWHHRVNPLNGIGTWEINRQRVKKRVHRLHDALDGDYFTYDIREKRLERYCHRFLFL